MYEQWLAMEQFYYEDVGVILIFFIIGAILSISTISHLSHWFSKVVNGIFLVFVIISGIFIFNNINQHGELMAKAKYVSPANRDFKRNVYRDEQYSATSNNLFRNAYMSQHFEGVGLYQSKEFVEEVEYLGRDSKGYLYFQIDGNIYLVLESVVTFEDEQTTAIRVGKGYKLIDEKLTELGFVSQSRIFFQEFRVPNSMIDKEFEREQNSIIMQHKEIVAKWVTPG